MFGDRMVVECRCAPVTINGFPIVSTDSWCTPGMTDTQNNKSSQHEGDEGEPMDSDEPESSDYIHMNNGDGSVITLHVPTTIMNLYKRVQVLEQELEIQKRRS